MDINHLGELLDISGYAIISLDSSMSLIYANKHAHKLMGVGGNLVKGSDSPIVISNEWISENMRNLLEKDRVAINSILLKNGTRLEVDGFVAGIFNGGDHLVGLSLFMKGNSSQVKEENNVKKRTFESIRLLILASLLAKRKTINQISSDIGVNWKTVENHLTYLAGKRLIKEVFSSKYVRIFEITTEGKSFARENSIISSEAISINETITNSISSENVNYNNASENNYIDREVQK